jgi:thiosulfate dehydrogenase [quinone] large subunit
MFNRAFLLSRLTVGISFLGHGLVRLPKLDKFSHGMAGHFQQANSILPQQLVLPFGYLLPFAEFFIGLLVFVGLFTRQALVAGGVVILLLIFGSTTIEDWEAIPSQMIHAVFFVGLLVFIDRYDCYSLDKAFRRPASAAPIAGRSN